ncbi:MAG: hypothetical protein AAFN30_13550 [Actinomycetota bacterium]
MRGVGYLLGISLAITGCSALVVVGMRTGRSGMSTIVLAAAVPLAGLAWAVMLSRLQPPPPARPMPEPAVRTPDLVGPDSWYA